MRGSLCVLLLCAPAYAQVVTDATIERQLEAILPSAKELAWRSAAWRPELRQALLEANELDRPIMLWAMNGHPLGQT